MDLDAGGIEEALRTLGDVLDSRDLKFEIVAVGGSALLILGIGARPTKDIDIVAVGSPQAHQKADPYLNSWSRRLRRSPLTWV